MNVAKCRGYVVFLVLVIGPCLVPYAHGQAWLPEIEQLAAEGSYEEALHRLASQESSLSGPAEQLSYLRLKSELEWRLGQLEQALETSTDWQRVARESGNQEELARALGREATLQRLQGELQSSETAAARAVEVARQTDASSLLLKALIEHAQVLAALGEYARAQEEFDEVQSADLASQAPEITFQYYSGQATLYSYQGYPEQAADYYREALQIARADLPHNLPTVLTNLAQSHLGMQRYAQALSGFQEVMELTPDPPVVTLTSVGICLYELNRFEEAVEIFEQARKIAQKAGNRRLEAWTIGEKGLAIWQARKDLSEGERLLGLSAQEFRAVGDLRNALIMEENLGTIWRDAALWEKALQQLRRVEEEYQKLQGQQIPANLFKSIGQCLLELGRHGEAEEVLGRARVRAEDAGDSKRIWQVAHLMARLVQETARPDEAEMHFQQALSTIESARQQLRIESFKSDFFEDKVRVYEDYIQHLIQQNPRDVARRTFELAERAKARSFLDTLAESEARLDQTLPQHLVNEEVLLLQEISDIQSEMRSEIADPSVPDRLAAKEADLQALYLRIRRDVPEFQEFRYPSPVSLEEIQENLLPEEVLLEFFLGSENSYRWLVTRQDIQMSVLPSSAQIETLVRSSLTLFLNPEENLDLRPLARVILSDLPQFEENSSLILIPSGILHFFPFEVLALAEETSWLWEIDTTYLPSASSLRFLKNRSRPATTVPRLLAIGNPSFAAEADQDRSSFGGLGKLGRLPFSGQEVSRVRSIFGSSQSTVLTGSEAQESTFKEAKLSEYSVLHLATHGWIDPQFPSRSGIVFGVDSRQDDGILQVREIYGLRLNADLVTLSACQTGLGRLVSGEGMVGLTRAFFYAGTDTVMATLWNINDQASSVFMERFYSALRAGQSKARAARMARIAMFQDGQHSHPAYWAPFVLRGLGSTPVQFPPLESSHRWVWLLSLGVLAGFVLTVLVLRLTQVRQR